MRIRLTLFLLTLFIVSTAITANAQSINLDNMTGVISANGVQLKSEFAVPLETINSSKSIRTIDDAAKIEIRFSNLDENLIIDERTKNEGKSLNTIILQVEINHISDNLEIDFVSKEGNKTAKRLKSSETIDDQDGRTYIFRLLSLGLDNFKNDSIFLDTTLADNIFLSSDLSVTVSLFVDSESLVPDPETSAEDTEEFGEETDTVFVSSLFDSVIQSENSAQFNLEDFFVGAASIGSIIREILNNNEIEKERFITKLNDTLDSLESANIGLERLRDIIKQAANNKELDKSTAKKTLKNLACAFRQDKAVIDKTKNAISKLSDPQKNLNSAEERAKYERALNSARKRLSTVLSCTKNARDLLKEKGFLDSE